MLNKAISTLRNSPGPILITGHTGFKGTWLTLLLEELGIATVGYSLSEEDNSMYQRLNRRGKIPEVFGDISDTEKLQNFFVTTKPSFVLHMAAQSLVLESYKNPAKTFETNVMGTVNVINAAFNIKSVEAVGIVTTDKVYRNNNDGKRFRESDPLEGKDPYSASKVAAESVAQAWRQIQKIDGGPRLVSLRAGNVIGGGDLAANRIIPDLIRGIISKEIVEIRNIDSTRPWQHVLDPVLGYLLALVEIKNQNNSNSYNFGPIDSSFSVYKLLEIVNFNFPNRINTKISVSTFSELESKFLDLDSTLANRNLNWSPLWTQEKAIIATFNWWFNLLDKKMDPIESTRLDIKKLIDFHGLI